MVLGPIMAMAPNSPELALFPSLLAPTESLSHCPNERRQQGGGDSQVNDVGPCESSVITQRGDEAHLR